MSKTIHFSFNDPIEEVLGFKPNASDLGQLAWQWYLNGEQCLIVAAAYAPYKYTFYGPEWVFEALFIENDESLLNRYE